MLWMVARLNCGLIGNFPGGCGCGCGCGGATQFQTRRITDNCPKLWNRSWFAVVKEIVNDATA